MVKNFAKHQNIKIKEKAEAYNQLEDIQNKETLLREISIKETLENQDKLFNTKMDKNQRENIKDEINNDLTVISKDVDNETTN